MLGIGLVYFFSVPDAFIATVFLLFAASARRRRDRHSTDIPSRAIGFAPVHFRLY